MFAFCPTKIPKKGWKATLPLVWNSQIHVYQCVLIVGIVCTYKSKFTNTRRRRRADAPGMPTAPGCNNRKSIPVMLMKSIQNNTQRYRNKVTKNREKYKHHKYRDGD